MRKEDRGVEEGYWAKPLGSDETERQEQKNKGGVGHTEKLILTGGASMEEVVVLRHVCEDTEAVRNFKGHHVVCIQQRWNSQLLRDPERLQISSTLSNKRKLRVDFKYLERAAKMEMD